MGKCEACEALMQAPMRSDVPAHLDKREVEKLVVGFVAVTTYSCEHCTTLWRWRVMEGWVPADAITTLDVIDTPPLNAAA